jgi:uncharacterized protein (TIGR02145 family)
MLDKLFYTRNKSVLFLLVILFFSGLFSHCKKKNNPESPTETDTLVDFQGNMYLTVKVGNQWWMAENLRVKVYNDGSPINEIFLDSAKAWTNTKLGAFCNLDKRYGLHYNWFALNGAKKLAPAGWHIPSDEEWKTLEKELGLSEEDANKTSWRGTSGVEKLFPPGSSGWPGDAFAPVYGTNKSGLNILPGGCRTFNGIVADLVTTAYFWTTTQNETSKAWYRNFSSQYKSFFRYYTYKNYGFSVRCVKD